MWVDEMVSVFHNTNFFINVFVIWFFFLLTYMMAIYIIVEIDIVDCKIPFKVKLEGALIGIYPTRLLSP